MKCTKARPFIGELIYQTFCKKNTKKHSSYNLRIPPPPTLVNAFLRRETYNYGNIRISSYDLENRRRARAIISTYIVHFSEKCKQKQTNTHTHIYTYKPMWSIKGQNNRLNRLVVGAKHVQGPRASVIIRRRRV